MLIIIAGIVSVIDFERRYCHGFKGVTTSADEVPDCFSKSTITPININPIIDGSEKIIRMTISVGMLSR